MCPTGQPKRILCLLLALMLNGGLLACKKAPVPDDPSVQAVPLQTQPAIQTTPVPPVTEVPTEETDAVAEAIKQETSSLPQESALPVSITAIPSGILTESNEKATIDYSNTQDGYVMVQYTAETEQRLKAQVKGPSTTYTYNLTPGQ